MARPWLVAARVIAAGAVARVAAAIAPAAEGGALVPVSSARLVGRPPGLEHVPPEALAEVERQLGRAGAVGPVVVVVVAAPAPPPAPPASAAGAATEALLPRVLEVATDLVDEMRERRGLAANTAPQPSDERAREERPYVRQQAAILRERYGSSQRTRTLTREQVQAELAALEQGREYVEATLVEEARDLDEPQLLLQSRGDRE